MPPWIAPCLLIITALLPALARADIDWTSVVWQNDLFAGKDGGGYTNGLFVSLYDLSWEGDDDYQPPALTQPLLWMINGDDSRAFSEHTIGQSMVTPEDIGKAVPDPNDAPYAGLLMYRASHIVIRDNFADNVNMTIGLIGPSTKAEQIQKYIHKVTGSERPMGWDYQLEDEPVFMLARTGIWRHALAGDFLDLILTAHARAGNLESSVGAGGIVRIGGGLADSFATTALSFGRISTPAAVNGSWYAYAGFEGDYVFNYIFVDGNTYRDSRSSDLKRQQLMFTAGLSYSWQNFSLSLAYKSGTAMDVLKTGRDEFGSLSLAWKL